MFIFGFTGILGKEIQQEESVIVLVRTAIGAAGILCFLLIKKDGLKRFVWKWETAAVGLIIAAHWITFFGAIKASTVSIAVAIMASGSIFVALIEPLIRRRPVRGYELVLGAVAMGALMLIFGFESHHSLGISLALVSSALAALFTVLNARLVEKHPATHISLQELTAGCLGVAVYLAIKEGEGALNWQFSAADWLLLSALGLVATAFAFVVSVAVMREVSPFTVALTINLEPVYTIFIALLLYGQEEKMSFGFYLGTCVLIGTVFLNTLLKRRLKRQRPKT